jgi:hypothetical protein
MLLMHGIPAPQQTQVFNSERLDGDARVERQRITYP